MGEAEEGLRTQLEETRTQNECLLREVSELMLQLNRANARVSELWSQQCNSQPRWRLRLSTSGLVVLIGLIE